MNELHGRTQRFSGIDRDTSRSADGSIRRVRTTRRHRELTDVSLRWSDLGLLLGCYVGLVAVWFTLGKIVVNSSAITSLDQRVADWFVDQRTADLDIASEWGSGLADTMVKIAVTALLAIGMWLAWKRWREPLMMVVPLVLEASAFITVTYLIARPRPDDQLESSPVNSSFPSGHVAAAAAYSALVIIVFWHTRKVWARALVVIVSIAVPVAVGARSDVPRHALPERRDRRRRPGCGRGRAQLVARAARLRTGRDEQRRRAASRPRGPSDVCLRSFREPGGS